MNIKCNRTGVILMGIISFFSLLTGCANHNHGDDTGKTDSELSSESNKGNAVELPEGVTLTGLYMTHQGMAREPYYIFRVNGENSYMKITSEAPDGYRMTEDDDYNEVLRQATENTANSDISPEEEIQYFRFVDEVKDCEHASLVYADETIISRLTDVIIQSGALKWDGYSKHKSMKNVDDAGDGYSLFLVFSDGSSVTVNSYNASPSGWGDFYNNVRSIFEETADYSRYAITELSEENCDRLIVEFYDTMGKRNDFRADIYPNEDRGVWVYNVRIKDTDGLYLEKGTDLSFNGEKNIDSLSYGYGRIIEILREHNVESWNGMQGTAAQGDEYMNILILDKDGKTIEVNGNIIPDDYHEVRDAFVEALIELYSNVSAGL